jgi:predicted unusual protein kinase regulating ubiquinone biosynthesis (AarF/ABC1/UbiB family)
VFEAFTRYLADRPDLAGGGPPAAARPAPDVRLPGNADLARLSAAGVLTSDPELFAEGVLHRRYRGRLRGGAATVVTLTRTADVEAVELDLSLLPSFADRFRPVEAGREAVRGAAEDFRDLVRAWADLPREAALLAVAAEDAESGGPCRPPAVEPTPGSRDILVLRRASGKRFGRARSEVGDRDRPRLAIRLLTAWLWQVFAGRVFATEFDPDDVTLLPGGGIEVDGLYVRLADATRADLWDYLVAVAAGEPDRAAGSLVRLTVPGPAADPADRLLARVRQAVPYRECRSAGGEDFGDLLLAYWRIAGECGYRMPFGLLRFHAATLRLRAAAADLAPGLDALRCAVENVRIITGLSDFRAAANLGWVREGLEHLTPLLLELPRKFDDALTQLHKAVPPRAGADLAPGEDDRPSRTWSSLVLPGLAVVWALTAVSGPLRVADVVLYGALAVLVFNLFLRPAGPAGRGGW